MYPQYPFYFKLINLDIWTEIYDIILFDDKYRPIPFKLYHFFFSKSINFAISNWFNVWNITFYGSNLYLGGNVILHYSIISIRYRLRMCVVRISDVYLSPLLLVLIHICFVCINYQLSTAYALYILTIILMKYLLKSFERECYILFDVCITKWSGRRLEILFNSSHCGNIM